MDFITSLTSQVVHKAMDGLSQRHKAISSNLANVDTPGYRRRDVSFEASLHQAMEEAKSQRSAIAKQSRPASNDEQLPMNVSSSKHFAIGHSAQSISGVEPQIVESEDVQFRNDGNAVDVETEMVQLTKNTQRFLALTKMHGRQIGGLKHIINNGG